MRAALKQTLFLWLSLLFLSGLSFLILQLAPVRGWLWQHTGEEAYLAQVKGLSDLLGDRLRPLVDLAPDAVTMDFSGSLRCGTNALKAALDA